MHSGCTREISSFECTLLNWNSKYSPGGTTPILVGVTGGIGIARGAVDPATAPVISLRVEKIDYTSAYNENYLTVSGRCWGERLFRRVITKTYVNQKAEAVIKDLLDNYIGLSHVRSAVELVEDTDTTYTKLEYDNTPAMDIFEYIAGSAVKTGVVGFDFRVAPDGKFEFFPKNSKTNAISLSGKLETGQYSKDINRIRNKITSIGIVGATLPRNRDRWTEPTANPPPNWTAISSNTTISRASSDPTPQVGSYCVKVTRPADSPDIVEVEAVITDEQGAAATLALIGGKDQRLNVRYYSAQAMALYVKLLAPDTSNYFITKTSWYNGVAGWDAKAIPVSAENEEVYWDKVGSPNWKYITKIRYWLILPIIYEVKVAFDEAYFSHMPYQSIREDSASQTAYGLREFVEVDDELHDDTACDLRAQALLAHFKDPAEYITLNSDSIDYGTTPILAGDKIHVELPNENIDADFRMDSAEYVVDAKAQSLVLTLELGRVPPRLAEYMYGLRPTTVTLEKVSRLKRGAIMVGAGGGADVDWGNVPYINVLGYANFLGDVTVEKYFVLKDVAGSGNYLYLMDVLAPIAPYDPMLFSTQALMVTKDVMSFGFFGTASAMKITFATWTSPVPSDYGKMVKDDGVVVGPLAWYGEIGGVKTWKIGMVGTIASGSVMTIVDGVGAGTTNAVSTSTGGGAILMGHGLSAATDMPQISMTDVGFDVLEIYKAIASSPYKVFGSIKVDTIYTDKLNTVTGSITVGNDLVATGLVNINSATPVLNLQISAVNKAQIGVDAYEHVYIQAMGSGALMLGAASHEIAIYYSNLNFDGSYYITLDGAGLAHTGYAYNNDISAGCLRTENIIPWGGNNTGYIGTVNSYWHVILADFLGWKTSHAAFDAMDDLARVKNYKITTEKRKNKLGEEVDVDIIDDKSLGFLKNEHGFYTADRSFGFAWGCLKKVICRLEELEALVKKN